MTGRDKEQDAWARRAVPLLLTLLIGLAIGYSARVNYSKDRYIQALAERHEAEASYWSKKTNEIITNNTLEVERRKRK